MRSVASLFLPLLVLVTLGLSGCGLLPDEIDETVSWPAGKLYSEAKVAMSDGAYEKAVKYYEKLESRFPYGRYAQQAQLEIAYAYYRQSEPASAIAACDRFIRLHPNHPSVDYALYLKGLVNFNEDLGFLGAFASQDLAERDPKAAKEAFETFKELVARFPDGKYAEDARLRMSYLVNTLANHEVLVARYYIRRGAYVAAINRAQACLKTYPESPAIEPALAAMIEAYNKLGITELRDDTVRILKLNFPDSPYLTEGYEGKTSSWWKLW
ncbi:MAG: outer membrane protein assembly factor BamD [Zoogloeaceae bacterium]|jgi:outer membrane protein assembly factor BamD|nr:outer membrane protein assembly factor BamD [Zoogloeaceae bacterium]